MTIRSIVNKKGKIRFVQNHDYAPLICMNPLHVWGDWGYTSYKCAVGTTYIFLVHNFKRLQGTSCTSFIVGLTFEQLLPIYMPYHIWSIFLERQHVSLKDKN